MVYAIKQKKNIQVAIMGILKRDITIERKILLAGLELETGMTKPFINAIIENLLTVGSIHEKDGILTHVHPEPQDEERQREMMASVPTDKEVEELDQEEGASAK